MPETAIITGGTKGLGLELVRKFLREGWNVATCARNAEHIPQLEAEFSDTPVFARAIDIREEAAVQSFVGEAYTRFGEIKALINNASILGPITSIDNYPAHEWCDVIETNLNGTFLMTKAVLPFMREVRSGVIMNITSSAGIKGYAGWGAYSASKFGLEGLSQILHEELENSGIRVHALDPGRMRTTMRAATYPEEDPATLPDPAKIASIIFDIIAIYEPKMLRLKSSDYL